jgi:hypothetical protein
LQDTTAFGRVAPPIRNDAAWVRRAKKYKRFLMVLLGWLDAELRGKALGAQMVAVRRCVGSQKQNAVM